MVGIVEGFVGVPELLFVDPAEVPSELELVPEPVCANDMPMAAHSAVTAAAMVTLLGSLFMDSISCVR